MAAFTQTRMQTAPVAVASKAASASGRSMPAAPSVVLPKTLFASRPAKASVLRAAAPSPSALRAATVTSAEVQLLEDQAILTEVAEQFNIWNSTLQTGEPAKVAALYAKDGVLLPTVSNKVRFDTAGKEDYFTAFLQLKPFGTINKNYVRFLSEAKDVAANSGIYTFKLTPPEGPVKKVQARFTFVYKRDPATGEWKIVEHHSSALPEDPLAIVAAQFDKWNSALQTGNPEKVAALYATESVLLPTVSNIPRTNPEGKVDYFTTFLKLKPFGTINEANVRFLDDAQTVAINSGIYTFRLEKDGKPAEVQARYTFTYAKDPETDDWMIVEHHSSAMPEPVSK